jgi:hypothetical protein
VLWRHSDAFRTRQTRSAEPGCARAQAVSRRLPTAATARAQTRVWSCGIL